MADADDQAKLDSIVRRLAGCGGISESSARRLVNDLFLREEAGDRYVRTEIGYVALGLSTFHLDPPPPIQERIDAMRRMVEQSPDNQPKPKIPTEEELRQNDAAWREMRFISLPIRGAPNHYRWMASILEEEAPEILQLWNQYCSHVSMLENWQQTLEEEPDPYRSAEEEEEEAPRGKPWPKESVRGFIRSAKVKAIQSRRVWNRERRKYWPVRLVVDNVVGEGDVGGAV